MQSKKPKNEMIDAVLDTKVQNLSPETREALKNILMVRNDITSPTACCRIIYSMLSLPRKGKGSKIYWLSRGWSDLQAEIKAKQHMKIINEKTKRDSPFSIAFWLKKINPVTGVSYTEDEANYARNSRRPIRKEYWLERGAELADAEQKARDFKILNNISGAAGSRSRTAERLRAHSHRTLDYWVLRGFSEEDATKRVIEVQTTFSLKKCIEQYGEEAGSAVWSDRQLKWMQSLKESGLHAGFSKIATEMFIAISEVVPDLLFGGDEVIISVDRMSYSVDCVYAGNKIIEFYGDYWHANPKKFTAESRIKKKLASNIWAHDAKKIVGLTSMGYQVLIIWESDFRKDQKGTIDKCIAFLTQ